MMLVINEHISIPFEEIKLSTIRSGGPGGQHANKVETAVQLHFDIPASSLAEEWKQKLLQSPDRRISKSGVIIIKVQKFRSQLKNKEEAYQRLRQFIQKNVEQPKKRIATKPSKASRQTRLEEKKKRSLLKELRKKVDI